MLALWEGGRPEGIPSPGVASLPQLGLHWQGGDQRSQENIGKIPPQPGVGHPGDTERRQLQAELKGQSWCWVRAPGVRLEEQQSVVLEGQRSLAPGARTGAKANTCEWFVTHVSTWRPHALSQLPVACDSQAQEGQIQGPSKGSSAIKVSPQAPVTSVAQPMLTY